MSQTQELKILEAIRDAVETAVAEFGTDFIRTLSMFPSAPANEEIYDMAA